MRDGAPNRSGWSRAVWLPAALAFLALAYSSVTAQETQRTEPLDIGQTEQVEVQLVLLDVYVLDRQGRTVPGLGPDDFVVKLDGRKVPVSTLDVDCPVGERHDPRVGERLPRIDGGAEPVAPRKIVLAFDYYHMDWAIDSVEFARRALAELQAGGEQHMVVSMGQILRIEQKLTTDSDAVIAALDRMVYDSALFAGHYDRLTERRVFDRLLALLDLMETIPGRKVVLLFSGPFLKDGWTHDPYYEKLAALAAATRTAIYPIDSRGLVPTLATVDPDLARIAVETGGRLTVNTNDLTLAYARAQRDLGCTYTLGLYDPDPTVNDERRVLIKMRPHGLLAHHPSRYVLRSPETKVRSMARTASMASEMFESDGLGSEAFVTRPVGPGKWEVVLALDVPAHLEHGFPHGDGYHLGGVVRRPSGTPVHEFKRLVRLDRPEAFGRQGERLFYERLKLRPGEYLLNLYLYNEMMDQPLAVLGNFVIPEVPRGEPFLVGPTIGRPAEGLLASAISPVLPLPGAEIEPGGEMASLTRLCWVGGGDPELEGSVARRVERSGGEAVEVFDTLPIDLHKKRKVHCQALVDEVATEALAAGAYNFRVASSGDDLPVGRATLGFSVAPD